MNNSPEYYDEMSQDVPNPGRRQLLKILAASGVVTAASLVPGKWSSPAIKTGVLPAHAQVTPGRFAIVCSLQWDFSFGEVDTTYFFSATATDNGNPLANVTLLATLDAGQASPTGTAITNAQGVANFSVSVPNNSITQTVVATITFNDPQIYGNASCAIVLEIIDA